MRTGQGGHRPCCADAGVRAVARRGAGTWLALAVAVLLLANAGAPRAAQAQALPKLVAKVYPGAVPEFMEHGKPATCGGMAAYCFLSKDPIEKVLAFYKQQGVQMYAMEPDHLRIHVPAVFWHPEEIAAVHQGPVEFHEIEREGSLDDTYFRSVIVMTRKEGPVLSKEKMALRNQLQGDQIFRPLVLPSSYEAMTPEMQLEMTTITGVQMFPEQLAPLYGRHIALTSRYFQQDDREAVPAKRLKELNRKRGEKIAAASQGTQAEYDKTRKDLGSAQARSRDVDAYLTALDKDAYATRILIEEVSQRKATRDPATVQREWDRRGGNSRPAQAASSATQSAPASTPVGKPAPAAAQSAPASAPAAEPAKPASPPPATAQPQPPPQKKDNRGEVAKKGFNALKKLF